ncbi:MAG: deoxyribonuclease V [Gemmataceae bacterium]
MYLNDLHSWNVTPAEAVQLQLKLAQQLELRTPLTRMELVAGADISYNKYDPTMYATVILYRVADGEIVEAQDAVATTTFPYVPGLLTFREAPSYLKAFAKLQTIPDVVMCDGQGIAHPRRMGLAAHLGLWLGVPTFGCAKSRLFGRPRELAPEAGSLAPLMDREEQIGYTVRTKSRCNPVFVSPGHNIDMASAVRVVLGTLRGYRIPEPTRRAHLRVNELRRNATC